MALRKWAGWIGFQPVLVLTDHKSLEHWTKEHVDTPSGPAARRGRWHETLSRFKIQVQYVPGKDKLVVDAMSRWAYPASQALADLSKHGSLEAAREARALIKEEDEEERAAARINAIRTDGPRLMLDLFSVTGSVGEAFREQGWEVISLDSNPACKADFTQDILEWDYKQFPRGHFQVITAGIPCTEFSRALTTRPRDLQKGDELALKTLEIIDYFQPQFWYIENPRHGLLSTRPYMTGIPFIDVDYCQFSDWGYQKPTRIWGSVNAGWHKDIKCNGRTCPNLDWQAWVVGTNPRRHHRELL
jgi:hypothetical protein